MPRTKQFDEQAVLERAMELFWKQGYHATSIQNLVDHLGINRASLYDTYGGKEALFEKAFNRYIAESSRQINALLQQYDSVREGLRALFLQAAREAVRDADHKGCFVVNTTTELIPDGGEWTRRVIKNREAFEALFAEHLRRGSAKGEIAPGKDIKALATYLFTLYNGLKVVSKLPTEESALVNMIDVALSVLED